MLVPNLRTSFHPTLHGTETIDLLYSQGSPLNRIWASWEVENTCLRFVRVQDDCEDGDRTKTIIFEMHNSSNFPLAGYTATYQLGDHPTFIRFSPFFDLAALYDPENSRHWRSPLLTALANIPDLDIAAANVVLSDPISSMHTTYMRFAPTPVHSSVPLATTTAPSITVSKTNSAPVTSSTSRNAPLAQASSETPPASPPQTTDSAFQHPIGRAFQKVLAFTKSLSPCKSILDAKPRKLSELRLPKNIQMSLAASRPTPSDASLNPPTSSSLTNPSATPDTASDSLSNKSSHRTRAFKYTVIIFTLVCIGAYIFSQLIGNPRRRVDRAASREERRNRRLYRHAARKQQWRHFWAQVGQKVSGKLEGTVWMERWRRRGTMAVERCLYRGLHLERGEDVVALGSRRGMFDEKGFRTVDEPGGAQPPNVGPENCGPSDLASEIHSLRYTHAVVDRMVRAEEGHAGGAGGENNTGIIDFFPPTSADIGNPLLRSTIFPFNNEVPRVFVHARRWSSASCKTGSDVTGPPPYGEEDLGLVDVDIRSEGSTGKSVNTDDTPDSSVVGTSPRASLFARERGSDVESGSEDGRV